MHGKYPGWSEEVAAGGKAKLTIFFDPNVHQHQGQDWVVQGVFIVSNDPQNPRSLVKIVAKVVE